MLSIDINVGRHRVVGRSRVGNRSLYTQLLEVLVENVNLRLSGALRGKRSNVSWEGRGE
jgi:hypothetical protein